MYMEGLLCIQVSCFAETSLYLPKILWSKMLLFLILTIETEVYHEYVTQRKVEEYSKTVVQM